MMFCSTFIFDVFHVFQCSKARQASLVKESAGTHLFSAMCSRNTKMCSENNWNTFGTPLEHIYIVYRMA